MMRAAPLAAVGVAFALATHAVACAPTDVIIATMPDAPDAAPPIATPPCVSDDDCPSDTFCARAECKASLGRCERRPVFCGAEFAPMCGCDGVTYWNECLRRRAGTPLRSIGECFEAPAPCGNAFGDCAEGASCSRVAPPGAPCLSPESPGVCWVVPDICEPSPRSSGPPVQQCTVDVELCVDACTAIRSQKPHHVAKPDVCPGQK